MNTQYRVELSDKSSVYFIAHDDHEAATQGQTIARQLNTKLLDIVIMKDYYPNNWEEVEALPDEVLPTISYSEVIQQWAGAWSLPSEINSIIRAKDRSGKVKEFVYRSGHHAYRRIEQLIQKEHEILVITNEFCHHINSSDHH